MHKKILVGLDASPGSYKALTEAIELAGRYQAELHTISVEEIPHFSGTVGEVIEEEQSIHTKLREAADNAKQMAEQRGVQLRPHILIGHPVKSIVEFVKEQGFDLLVIGFHGHSALYERIMGSTGHHLTHLASCSILVAK